MHGLEVCRQLKADPRNRLTPIILNSAAGDDSDASKALARGRRFLGHAPTPWEALGRVHSMLEMKTYIDEQAESVLFSLAKSIEVRDPF